MRRAFSTGMLNILHRLTKNRLLLAALFSCSLLLFTSCQFIFPNETTLSKAIEAETESLSSKENAAASTVTKSTDESSNQSESKSSSSEKTDEDSLQPADDSPPDAAAIASVELQSFGPENFVVYEGQLIDLNPGDYSYLEVPLLQLKGSQAEEIQSRLNDLYLNCGSQMWPKLCYSRDDAIKNHGIADIVLHTSSRFYEAENRLTFVRCTKLGTYNGSKVIYTEESVKAICFDKQSGRQLTLIEQAWPYRYSVWKLTDRINDFLERQDFSSVRYEELATKPAAFVQSPIMQQAISAYQDRHLCLPDIYIDPIYSPADWPQWEGYIADGKLYLELHTINPLTLDIEKNMTCIGALD